MKAGLVGLKGKNLISEIPLKDALNAFIFALNDSAKAFAALWQRSSMPHRNACTVGSPDKHRGLGIQPCKSEREKSYILWYI